MVNPTPTVTANTSSTSICSGSSIILTGGGASSYIWTGGISDGVSFIPPSTNSYTVIGTAGTCSNSAVVSVTVNSLPVVLASATASNVCVGNAVTLSGSGASSYIWTNGVTDGVSFTPTATSVYSVIGTDVNGCTSTSTVEVTVSPCTGIEEFNSLNSVALYPNPSNGEITIKSQIADVIFVSNELGQIIKTIELNQSNHFTYQVNNLTSGIYFIAGKLVKQKLIVTK